MDVFVGNTGINGFFFFWSKRKEMVIEICRTLKLIFTFLWTKLSEFSILGIFTRSVLRAACCLVLVFLDFVNACMVLVFLDFVNACMEIADANGCWNYARVMSP